MATAPISSPPADPPRPASAPGRGDPGLDQMAAGGDEVRERVGLVLHPTVLVPGASHLPAAAHVRDGEDHAPVEQGEPVVRERRVDGDLVGAVAVEERQGAGSSRPAAVHDRDRDTRPVGGDGPLAEGGVARRVEVAQDGLLLEQRLLAVGQAHLQDAGRRDERRAPDPQRRRVRLGVGPEPRRRRAVDGGDDPARVEQVDREGVVALGQGQDAHPRLGLGALAQHQGGREGVDVLDAHARPVRHHLVPGLCVLASRGRCRGRPGRGSRGRRRWSGPRTSPVPPAAGVRWSTPYSTPSRRGITTRGSASGSAEGMASHSVVLVLCRPISTKAVSRVDTW